MTTKIDLMKLLQQERTDHMELLNITVDGFRNLSHATIHLDAVTSLVGLNGCGKSNLLDAIDFGIEFLHASSSVKRSMMASTENIPLLKDAAGKHFAFSFEAKTGSSKQPLCVRYGFEFSWQTEKNDAGIVREFLLSKKDEKGQKYRSFISRIGGNAKYRTSDTGRCDKTIKIEDFNLVLSKLLAFDELFYADLLKKIDGIQFFIEKHLDAGMSFTPNFLVLKGFQELDLNRINNIPRAIYHLKQQFPQKYELLIHSFQQLFPVIQEINVEEHKWNHPKNLQFSDDVPIMFSDSIYAMRIVDDRLIQPISFDSLSDGTKRVFLMLTMATIADLKGLSLIAIEEPENSIHPSLLQHYLDTLSQLIGRCKIIVSSHSPYIVQYLDPKSTYIAHSGETGEAIFERIAAGKVNALLRDAADNDESVGDYIFNILSSSNAREFFAEYIETDG